MLCTVSKVYVSTKYQPGTFMIGSYMILISCTHIRHNSCIPYLKRLRQGTYFATPEGWDGSEVDACGNGVFSTSAALRKWVDASRQGLYLFVQSYLQLPNSIPKSAWRGYDTRYDARLHHPRMHIFRNHSATSHQRAACKSLPSSVQGWSARLWGMGLWHLGVENQGWSRLDPPTGISSVKIHGVQRKIALRCCNCVMNRERVFHTWHCHILAFSTNKMGTVIWRNINMICCNIQCSAQALIGVERP